MEDIEGRETASEMQESAQQTTPFNLKNEFKPPPPLPETEDPPVDDPDQEPSPPSPEDPPPPPPPDCTMGGLGGADLPDDLDEEDPPLLAPLPDYNEDPPPLDSDEEDPPPSDEEEEGPPPPSDDEGDDPHITLENMKTNLQFVRMVEQVTLASQFSPAELYLLRNPGQIQFCPSDDPDLHLSIAFYILLLDHCQSQCAYAASCKNIKARYLESEMLSYDQVTKPEGFCSLHRAFFPIHYLGVEHLYITCSLSLWQRAPRMVCKDLEISTSASPLPIQVQGIETSLLHHVNFTCSQKPAALQCCQP